MKRSMIFLLLLLTLCTSNALTQDFSTNNDKVYTAVEQMPQFPGGDSKLMKYISENIKYPETDECVDGQVIVQFVVTKTGEVGDVKVRGCARSQISSEIHTRTNERSTGQCMVHIACSFPYEAHNTNRPSTK